jgi:hypothetical protein
MRPFSETALRIPCLPCAGISWPRMARPHAGSQNRCLRTKPLGPRGTRAQAGLRRTLSPVAKLAPLVSRGGERRPTGSRAAGLKAKLRLRWACRPMPASPYRERIRHTIKTRTA